MSTGKGSAGRQPWERLPRESAPAFEAFRVFLELGPGRTVAEAIRQLGKRKSLIWRWATRHDWRRRAWACDVQRDREDEEAVRRERETVLQQRLQEVDQMGRACLIFFRTLVRRDPETGEVSFDPRFTPPVAQRFLELALRAQGAFALRSRGDDEDQGRPAAKGDLFQLTDGEVEEMIALAKERAQQNGQEEQEHASDKGSTQEEADEDTGQQDERPGNGEQDSA